MTLYEEISRIKEMMGLIVEEDEKQDIPTVDTETEPTTDEVEQLPKNSDVYSFECLSEPPKFVPAKIFFKKTNLISKTDKPLDVIEFINDEGQTFEFDKNIVKFSKIGDGFVLSSDFLKYYNLDDLKEGKKYCKSNIDSEMSTQIKDALKQAFEENWYEAEKGLTGFTAGLRYIHTIGEKTGDGETWSIMNFFDTKPEIQSMIKKKYQTENPENLELVPWLVNIFKTDKVFLKKLLDRQWESIENGIYITEKKIINQLKELFPNLEIITYPPGSKMDRWYGVDFTINGINFQVKPLSSYKKTEDGYLVNTYGMKSDYQDKKYLNYIVYFNKDNMLIFPKTPYELINSGQVLHTTEPVLIKSIVS